MSEKIICTPANVAKFRDWLANRGGLAVWPSVNLSNPGVSWTTPARTAEGEPFPKPTWQAANAPERIVTSEDDVEVVVDKEVKRFHVAVRMGSEGFMIKVTDGGSRRIRREVAKAGEGAYHVFDYGDYDNAVIMAPEKRVPLREWKDGQ